MLPECKVKVIRTAVTYAGDLEQMPELPLSLDLHLHHRVVGILDALQGLLNAWEQVNDLLLAYQDLTVEEKGRVGVRRGAAVEETQSSNSLPSGHSYPRWV